jgi:hypothetical protein
MPSATTEPLDPVRGEWAIDARARSQRLMLALYKFGLARGYDVAAGPDGPADLNSSVYAVLVSVSFSLWRAACLTEMRPRNWPEALRDAQALLETVLKSNAVFVTTEHTLQGWTGGYYLNNIRLRLRDILDREVLANRVGREDLEAVTAIELVREDPTETWNRLYDVAERVLERLTRSPDA